MANLTQEQADKVLARWQEALRLRDWDIEIKVEKDGRTRVDYELTPRTALIHLVTSDDADVDPEVSVVHELKHLQFAALDPVLEDGVANVVLEQALATDAALMVSLLRAARPAKTEPAPASNVTELPASTASPKRSRKRSTTV